MRISVVLRAVLIIDIIVLLGFAIALSRDYQDSWILEGLEIPFIVFVATYIAYCFVEDKISWTIIFVLIARCVFLIIPNLKYTWFQGVNFDQNYHFRIIQDIYNKGYVPAGYSYSGTPFMHLLADAYSITTGSSVLFTFKYLPIMSWLLFPLVTYSIVRLAAPRNQLVLKYAVLVSSIPVEPTLSLVVVGTTFGALLTISLLSQFVRALHMNTRSYALVAIISVCALVIAHSYSVTLLAAGLLMTYLAGRSEFVKDKLKMFGSDRLYMKILLLLIVLDAAWLMFSAHAFFLSGTQIVQQWANAIFGAKPAGGSFTDISWSFFGLSFANQLRIVTVFYGGTLLSLLLTFFGILVARRIFHTSKILSFMSAMLLSVWLFFVVQIVSSSARAGLFEYGRLFDFSYIFAPIFVGVLLYYLQERLHSVKLNFLLCLLLVAVVVIELYGCQPLLPIANSVRSNLPSDEYIIYVGEVNSVYQRSMIVHAEKHIRTGMIACDSVTENQILGLTEYNFSQSHLWGYPFDERGRTRLKTEKFDYLLIHVPGKSGSPKVAPEVGTRSFVLAVAQNSSVIYSNGESYVLAGPFMFNNTP